MLFTDGEASDGDLQIEEATKLKQLAHVKIIAVAMGKKTTIDKYRGSLRKMASDADDGSGPLQFELDFEHLDAIINVLVKDSCSKNTTN